MNIQLRVPSYDDFFTPTFQALKELGGSGTVQEIYDKVCELGHFSLGKNLLKKIRCD